MPFDGSSSRPTPVKVRWTSLADLRRGGLEDILPSHWQESAEHQDKVPLDVAWQRYAHLEREGAWICMAAWKGGKVIGYAGYIVSPHLQFQSTIHVLNSSIYVVPGQRGIALAMIRKAARLLTFKYRPRPVVIVYEAPKGSQFAEVLEKIGYPQTATVHTRVFP